MADMTDVLVAAYQDLDKATRDFDALAGLVKDKKAQMEAAILITHAADGSVSVQQTADHRGRKGVEWGAGVGFLVGLAAPPLLASTAIGAALGGLAGKHVDKELESQMHDKIGENLPEGGAAIIAAFDEEFRLAVEQALPGSPAKSVVETDKQGIKALKAGLPEAMQKFVPDRTKLPIPSKAFGGVTGESLDKSIGDWTIIPGPKAPADAPNVLVVLIDDAGFGATDTFGASAGVFGPGMIVQSPIDLSSDSPITPPNDAAGIGSFVRSGTNFCIASASPACSARMPLLSV